MAVALKSTATIPTACSSNVCKSISKFPNDRKQAVQSVAIATIELPAELALNMSGCIALVQLLTGVQLSCAVPALSCTKLHRAVVDTNMVISRLIVLLLLLGHVQFILCDARFLPFAGAQGFSG